MISNGSISHRDYHHVHTTSLAGNKIERVTSLFSNAAKKPESPTTKKTQKIAQTLRGLVSAVTQPAPTEEKLEKNTSGNLNTEPKETCHILMDQIRTNLIRLTDGAPKKPSPAQGEGRDSGSDRRHEMRDVQASAVTNRADRKPIATTITLASGLNLFPKTGAPQSTKNSVAPLKNSPGSTATSTSTYCMLSPRNTFVNNRIGAGTKASLPKFRSKGPSIIGMTQVTGEKFTTGTGTGTTTTTNSTATKIKEIEPPQPLYVFSPNIEGRIMNFLQSSKIELTSSPYNGHAIKKKEAPTLTLAPRKKFMRV